jgi:hypothetical protein
MGDWRMDLQLARRAAILLFATVHQPILCLVPIKTIKEVYFLRYSDQILKPTLYLHLTPRLNWLKLPNYGLIHLHSIILNKAEGRPLYLPYCLAWCGWTVRGSYPSVERLPVPFRSVGGSPNLLYNGYRFFRGHKFALAWC